MHKRTMRLPAFPMLIGSFYSSRPNKADGAGAAVANQIKSTNTAGFIYTSRHKYAMGIVQL
ncbi:hypothetical protein [Niastella koreensis]|uniref:hypothetical protein n=1 Tax=Niastella koreensis TaxID=354356 RepID=UPI001054A088|nr:hypothetical protein [Niastella koreensis]